MNKKYLTLCLLLLLAGSFPATKAGGTQKQDAGLWLYASIMPKLFGEKWQTTCALEYRSRGPFRETSLWCTSTNVNYLFNLYMQIGAGYELFLNREADGRFSPEHRYYPEAIFSYCSGAYSAGLRLRLMNTFTRADHPLWEGRNRLKLGYSIAGTILKPFIAAEPYHEFYPVVRHLKKIRYYTGCTFRLHQRRQAEIYYLRENHLHTPFARNVIGIDYNYTF